MIKLRVLEDAFFIYDQIRKKHPKIKEKVGIAKGLFPIYPTIGIQKGVLQNLQTRPAYY